MKILSLEGNFGKICDEKIEFNTDFNIINLKNEGGKTTYVTFIKVMLFGLSKSKRDTKNELSERTKYFPHDGRKMWGKMRILYKNRIIILTRISNKSGAMQEFSAVYEDTGAKCDFLTGKDAGNVLLGIDENSFEASAFIDGTNLKVSSPSLEDSMLSLSNTGDSTGAYNMAKKGINKQKLDLKSRTGTGKLSSLLNHIEHLTEQEQKHEQFAQAVEKNKTDISNIDSKLIEIENYYINEKQKFEENSLYTRMEIQTKLTESERRLSELIEKNIDEHNFKLAQDALFSYDGALKAEKETREKLPFIQSYYENELSEIYRKSNEYEQRLKIENRKKVKWWAFALSLLFAVLGVTSIFMPMSFGIFTPYMPYIFSFMAVLSLFITFLGFFSKNEIPYYDVQEEKKALNIRREELEYDHKRAIEITTEYYEKLLSACKKLRADCTNIESCRKVLFETENDILRLHNISLEVEKLRAMQKISDKNSFRNSEQKNNLDEIASKIDELKTLKMVLTTEMNETNGKKSTLMPLNEIKTKMQTALEQKAKYEKTFSALEKAELTLEKAYDALSDRLSPEINALCAKYMEIITENKYDTVYIRRGFEASLGEKNALMHSLLTLSSSTKDALYFSLRLAACQILAPKTQNIPIILDDPFITFDDDRIKKSMSILRDLSKDRQIILFSFREYP